MQVWTQGDLAILKCSYEEKEMVKALGDFKFNKADATWHFPLRKLVDIIDTFQVNYSSETHKIYLDLVELRKIYHAKINLSNEIKESSNEEYSLDGVDLSGLYEHQKKAVKLASLFDSYALFMETGTGKTLCALKLVEYWKAPTMIVAPLSTLESVWKREIAKWTKLRSVILWDFLAGFERDYDIYLINYEQFKILSKKSLIPIQNKIKCLIIDESSKLKNPSSEITKTVVSFRNKIPHKLVLTGTPAPNNLLEYFSQIAFINPELLGDNFYKFRNTYFYSTGYGGYLYKPMQGAKESIIDKVSRQAYSVRKDDCLDLPERTYEVRDVYMDEAQTKAYDQMKKENIMEFKGNITLGANELAKLMKLRQITGGFTITTQGIPVLISDSKIKALKDLLDEIPEDKQVIIWIQFHWELKRLQEEFKDQCCVLYGEMSQGEKQDSILNFQNGSKRILIGHPLTGGMGINFQNCSYIVWYSLSYSQEQYSQANDRIYRIGQVNKCTYFLLLAKKTIDEVIYRVLDKKADLMHECMEMLKQ